MKSSQPIHTTNAYAELVSVIIADHWGRRMAVIEDEPRRGVPEPYVAYPRRNEDGLTIYDMPAPMAKEYLMANIAGQDEPRFLLYRSAPLQAKKTMPSGTSRYVTLNPWYYEIAYRTVADPRRPGQTKQERYLIWHENTGEMPWNTAKLDPTQDPAMSKREFKPETVGAPASVAAPVAEAEPAQATSPPEPKEETPEPPIPFPPVDSKPVAVLSWYRAHAGDIIGTDTVKDLEREYRQKIGKDRGMFSAKELAGYIQMLNDAVAKAEAEDATE